VKGPVSKQRRGEGCGPESCAVGGLSLPGPCAPCVGGCVRAAQRGEQKPAHTLCLPSVFQYRGAELSVGVSIRCIVLKAAQKCHASKSKSLHGTCHKAAQLFVSHLPGTV